MNEKALAIEIVNFSSQVAVTTVIDGTELEFEDMNYENQMNVLSVLLQTTVHLRKSVKVTDRSKVKSEALDILKDIIKFWQPTHGDAILQEFEKRLKNA